MNIFIFQSGEPLHIDNNQHNPMRCINLANHLITAGYKVNLISSNFDHNFKKHRKSITKSKFLELSVSSNFQTTLIDSPGYSKNISFSRLYDHFILSKNLIKYLKSINNLPDFFIIGFPPIETTIFLSYWLNKNNIPYVVDIKDLWPEYFYARSSSKIKAIILKILFFSHEKLLNQALKKSYALTANNEFFLNFTIQKIKRTKNKHNQVIYLTKPKLKYIMSSKKFDKEYLNIYFGGKVDLKRNDFQTVLESLKLLKQDNINFIFRIAGYGDTDQILKLINENNLKKEVIYLGYLDEETHITMLKESDVFIAPLYNNINYSSNLSNKFIECIQYHLPLITPLTDYISKFIKENKIGLIYREYDSNDLYLNFKYLYNDKTIIINFKKNIEKLESLHFNHLVNYTKFEKIINSYYL